MMHLDLCCFLAAGKTLEEIEDPEVETTALALAVRIWVARQITACLHHRSPLAMNHTQWKIEVATSNQYHSPAFKAAPPKYFDKAMAFLGAEFGSLSFVYDKCFKCPFVYRGQFQDDLHCTRCCAPRYYQTGNHRNAIARLVVCPVSEWVKYLWRRPEFAK